MDLMNQEQAHRICKGNYIWISDEVPHQLQIFSWGFDPILGLREIKKTGLKAGFFQIIKKLFQAYTQNQRSLINSTSLNPNLVLKYHTSLYRNTVSPDIV